MPRHKSSMAKTDLNLRPAAGEGPPPAIVGIDVGTSTVKAAFISSEGLILHQECIPLNSNRRTGGISCQDPNEWLTAIDKCLELKSPPHEVVAIGICANCSTLVPTSCGNSELLDLAWMWDDTRAEYEARTIQTALSSKGISRRVTSNEPCGRFLKWSRQAPQVSGGVRFWEAATWIISQLTGNAALPQSIYYGRWGLLADPQVRSVLFTQFPMIESIYVDSIVRLVGWKDCLGHVRLPRVSEDQPERSVPLFSTGNDGMTGMFGSGCLLLPFSEFFILGTSKLHIIAGECLDDGVTPIDSDGERLPNVDILFQRSFTLRDCQDRTVQLLEERIRRSKDATYCCPQNTICVLGGATEMLERFGFGLERNLVRCGRYAGAVGAAALSGIAAGVLPQDIELTSEMIRRNWVSAL
jgi:hypothetical protein